MPEKKKPDFSPPGTVSTGVAPNSTPRFQGATVVPKYWVRSQEYVNVTRSDLEDLRDFDTTAIRFGALGTFFMSGAAWLWVEKALEDWKAFFLSPMFWVCGLCVIVGLFLIWQGTEMHRKKASRIDRIFNETTELVDVTTNAERSAQTETT